MVRHIVRILSTVILVVMLSGCDVIADLLGTGSATPPAVEMLPDLPNHTVIEGQTLTDYISTLSEGAALLAGQPQLAALAAGVDQIISCYQDIGAVQARVYSHEDKPLSAGAVAIADKNALLSPTNLFRCVSPLASPGETTTQTINFEPCSASYTLEKDGNEFYIIYAGTTAEICQAFCAQLEGCTAH